MTAPYEIDFSYLGQVKCDTYFFFVNQPKVTKLVGDVRYPPFALSAMNHDQVVIEWFKTHIAYALPRKARDVLQIPHEVQNMQNISLFLFLSCSQNAPDRVY